MKTIELEKRDLEALKIKTTDDLKRFEEATNRIRAREGKVPAKVTTDYILAPSGAVQYFIDQERKKNQLNN